MNLVGARKLRMIFGVMTVVFILGVPAYSELVFDNPADQAVTEPSVQASPAAEDRETLRQVIKSSEKAHDTVSANTINAAQTTLPTQVIRQPVQIQSLPLSQPVQTMQVTQALPVVQTEAPSTQLEVQNLSRSELIRRERLRAELKNEDILQERLEELRLRDERQRTNQLVGISEAQGQTPATMPVTSEQVVVAPVTEHPGVQSNGLGTATGTAMASATQIQQQPLVQQTQMAMNTVTNATSVAEIVPSEQKTIFTLTPRGGISNMAGNSYYNIQSRYTAGLEMAVGISTNLGFSLGYSYGEYGVSLASTNPYVVYSQYSTGATEALAMKQNVVDAGLKVYLLGSEAKLRPYIGAGVGYSKSYINYDQRIIDDMTYRGWQNLARDYEVSSFLGSVSTGFDIRLSKDVSVGAVFKYHTVLTARENQNLYNPAFVGYGYGLTSYYGGSPYYASAGGGVDPEKKILGGSLARSGFYSILGGINFTF